MNELETSLLRGERTMSQGFIAQYAADAARQTPGVSSMDRSTAVAFKEAFGLEHEGYGVEVSFLEGQKDHVSITVFPIVYYGVTLPEVAWAIQQNVKNDVEKYTGLIVDAVNVHIKNVVDSGEKHEKIL